MSRATRPVLAALALALLALAGTASSALATTRRDEGLLLTVAARSCPAYTDITANLARNNIMESLRDLGADTAYRPGEAIDPEVEQSSQPDCTPLPDWRFTLGDSYRTRAVTGPWGALSIVTNPFDTDATTKDEVALLDPQGLPTGKTIKGATTIRLSPQEALLAARRSLWIQGGTTTDPILDQEFPGPQYGFGALRCAVDDLNGDNVEYIAYPAGVTHVFCFAYYVEPPPTSGTIVVRKEVKGPAGIDETFRFDGNISYNPGGNFNLGVRGGQPAQETFFRGATTGDPHPPWTVREQDTPDWKLDDLNCVSRDGTSTIDASTAAARASIDLAPGDHVTCTYTNEYAPPSQGLTLRKVSHGGTGHFTYSVVPLGGGDAAQAAVTTTEEGIAAEADPSPLDLAAGRYEVTEQMPESDGGHWVLKAVECDGTAEPVKEPIEVTVSARAVRACTFTNDFVPKGAISISKITRGGVGTTGFVVSPLQGEPAAYEKSATTVKAGEPALAKGDPTGSLELGDYVITDLPPAPKGGLWTLTYVECDGRAMPSTQGRIEVALTVANPRLHCVFTNSFDPTPPPVPPQPQPPSPDANLVLTKRADVAATTVGKVITYKLTVANHGSGPAGEVTLIDEPQGAATLVSATTDAGSCGEHLPLVCPLGSLEPGATASLTVRMKARSPGLFVNRAVVGTETTEASVRNSEADSKVHVKAVQRHSPFPTGLG
jgi:uncharacterized repeat protein (TIGR01451 family)